MDGERTYWVCVYIERGLACHVDRKDIRQRQFLCHDMSASDSGSCFLRLFLTVVWDVLA